LEAPFEVVGPGVVRALDAGETATRRLFDEPRPAVPADVVEAVEPPFRVAHHDDALRPDGPCHVVAGAGEVVLAPDAQPHLREDAALLLLEDDRVVVVAPGEGGRLVERHPDGRQVARGLLAIEPGFLRCDGTQGRARSLAHGLLDGGAEGYPAPTRPATHFETRIHDTRRNGTDERVAGTPPAHPLLL